MSFLRLNLNINQLIGSDLFLGYHRSNWNSYISYFLLGRRRGSHIFNMHYTYVAMKRVIFLLSEMLFKKCHIWLINENFDFFMKSGAFFNLSRNIPELYFYTSKWYKGFLSNYKFVKFFKPIKFPHLIAVPNIQNNHYAVNEARIINIPSVGLLDTIDNPINVFYPIPGNSKSIKSTLFFYLMFSKSAFYSRYLSSSSFFFTFLKKSKSIFMSNTVYAAQRVSSVLSTNFLHFYKKGFLINSFRITKSFIRKFIFGYPSILGIKPSFFWKTSFSFSVYFYLNTLKLSLYRILKGIVDKSHQDKLFVKTLITLFL